MVKTLSVEQNKLDLKFQKGIILSQILKRSNLELRDFVFPLGELPQDEVGSGFVVESGVVDPHHRVVHPQVEPQQAKKSGRHDSLKEKHQKNGIKLFSCKKTGGNFRCKISLIKNPFRKKKITKCL